MMMTGEQADAGSAGATRVYECPQRDQLFLLPVSMRDWLDEGHLAWFVIDVVAAMDTSALHRRPGGCPGRPPYLPEMMCAVLLYAYCCGVRSSRRIEAACRTDAAFRVICGGLVADHATIARFVVCHEQALEGLFVEGVRLCAAAGLADLSVLALDGTKIAADASLARNRDREWIAREITKLMALTAQEAQPAPTADSAQALPGVEPDAAISCPKGRMGRLKAALAVIEAEDAAAHAHAQREAAAIAAAAAAEAEHGRKLRGRKPQDPARALARAQADQAAARTRRDALVAAREAMLAAAAVGQRIPGPRPCRIKQAQAKLERAERELAAAQTAVKETAAPARRVNITDPDSRIMTTKDGWVQGYNAQAIVNQHQIVLACEVSQNTNDIELFDPMTGTLDRTLAAAGITTEIQLILADAGYCSDANLTSAGPDRLIATMKDYKQRRAARELGITTGPPPLDATPTEAMEHLLRTPQGTAAYKQRSCLIEPVFGNHKHNRGIRQFRRRGQSAVRSEWAFINLAGNILKLHQHDTVTA